MTELKAGLRVGVSVQGAEQLGAAARETDRWAESFVKAARGLRSVEQEMARLNRLEEQRANTAEARKRLGLGGGPGFFTGHGFANSTRSFIGGLRDIGGAYYAVSSAAHLAAGAVHSVLDPYREYSRLLSEAKAKANFTPDELAAIDAKAKSIGRTSIFTPTEAAGAAVTLAEAGVKGAEIPHTLNPTLKLAQALHMSTEESAHALLQTATQFGTGITEKSFTHIGDVLTRVKTSSTASIEEITESLKYVGPVANAAGFSLEKTASIMGVLAEGGIKGSMAGTGFARVLVGLSKPTKAAQKELAHLGLSVKDTQKGMENPAAFFEMLGHKTEKYSKAQKLALMNTLFGARGQVVALELSNAALRNNGQLWQQLDDRIAHAGGTMDKVSDAMGNTLDGRIKHLAATWETAKITLAERLAPAADEILPPTADLVTTIAGWTAENLGLAAVFAGAGTAAGAAFIAAFGIAATLGATAAGLAIAGAVKIGLDKAAEATTPEEKAAVAQQEFNTGETGTEEAIGATIYDALHGGPNAPGANTVIGRSHYRGMPKSGLEYEADKAKPLSGDVTNTPQVNTTGFRADQFTGHLEITITPEGKPRIQSLTTKGPLRVGANVGGM